MISILMPTYVRYQYTKKTVNSIFENCDQEFELIIWNNNSPEEKLNSWLQELEASHENVRVKFANENTGPPGAFRGLMQMAEGEYSCMIGNDFYIPEGFFSKQIESIKQLPEQSLVRPVFLDPEGTILKSAKRLKEKITPQFYWFKDPHKKMKFADTKFSKRYLNTDLSSNCGMFYKTNLREDVLFNDDVFVGIMDYDFSLECIENNYQVFVDTSLAIHDLEKTGTGYPDYEKQRRNQEKMAKGLSYFFEKWNWLPVYFAPLFLAHTNHPNIMGKLLTSLKKILSEHSGQKLTKIYGELIVIKEGENSWDSIQSIASTIPDEGEKCSFFRSIGRRYRDEGNQELAVKGLKQAVNLRGNHPNSIGDWFHLATLAEEPLRSKARERLKKLKPELYQQL